MNMQKIKLFSQYDMDVLFYKEKMDIGKDVNQWPDAYFSAENLPGHIDALAQQRQLQIPQVDFLAGRSITVDRIYPASALRPGGNPNKKLKVKVLVYQYPFTGESFLLGCKPRAAFDSIEVEWLLDAGSRMILAEYPNYESNPKQIIRKHNAMTESLQQMLADVAQGLEEFNDNIRDVIEPAIYEKQQEVIERQRVLSALR